MDSFTAGAAAGLLVDISLYPIDTIKTRMQAKAGFRASGGFKDVYKGLSTVVVGSVPGGAVFFCAYDSMKSVLSHRPSFRGKSSDARGSTAVTDAMAAAFGESCACCVRVPVEKVKQQMQAGHHRDVLSAITAISARSPANVGGHRGGLMPFFHGMPIMLLRDIPFATIQMSLYETMKRCLRQRAVEKTSNSNSYNSLFPFCGALCGGFAALVTTPLDVLKTRIMLESRLHGGGIAANIRHAFSDVLHEPPRPNDHFGTCQKFFRGASARVLWISLGGGIFLGTYEAVQSALHPHHTMRTTSSA